MFCVARGKDMELDPLPECFPTVSHLGQVPESCCVPLTLLLPL